MQTFLNPAEARATLLTLAAWGGALLFAVGVDLGWLHRVVEGLFDNPMAWETALTLVDIDEVMLAMAARLAGLLRISMPTALPALGSVIAGVLAVLVAFRFAAAGRPATAIEFPLAFLLCQERRHTSLHFTSEQFWLRIRGR